jgi:NADH-quinone oxidoreductase subunit M
VAVVQKDMKKLIAYSSIAHMAFVTLASFAIYYIVQHGQGMPEAFMAFEGAMFQMIAHAFGSGAMFIGVGILYDQMHTRDIHDFGGIANKMPIFAAFFMLFALSNVGLPGTSGFVGEFMILLSLFKANFWVLALASSTVVLSAAYTLWMYKRVFFGEVNNPAVNQLKEVNWIEKINLSILGFMIIALGVYPNVVLNLFHATTTHLLQLSLATKLI